MSGNVTDVIKSNLFADYFSAQNFRSEPIPLDYSIENKFLNKNIELWELRKSIQKMRNTTPGADNIPAAWFKKLEGSSLLVILHLFNQQLSFSPIPKSSYSLIVDYYGDPWPRSGL
ncbi:uncharacterized protein CDAR_481121 [Caerostris darwini]|uniref:Uncharacterized protein n=1 Tax=Caerostris darwini TaxID=1538125 RepID=A0AAV4SL98_9ARAC|nr:uncharacterized protein CDAR_481121 [Caerostris darwini]